MTNSRPEGKIDKGWGYELIWATNEHYCGKIMVFDKVGAKTALNFHQHKHKSWFVNSGKFLVRWVDTKDAKMYQKELTEGQVWHVPTLQPHQLEAVLANSSVSEVSTVDNQDDNYSIVPGDDKHITATDTAKK
jgi:mannose-6-phosphate isomerase-like protein (cupin superfamily)